jgi:flagellar biosynthesis GTPase FlhF
MLLTKDNLLKFVAQKKAVTPTDVAETFQTTTMIGSAALSELAKDNHVKISYLKLGSTPYYYDPRQKECLIALGEAQYSKYEKETFNRLRTQEIIPEAAMSVQERVAVLQLKDFAIPLSVTHEGAEIKFWVWYLRNVEQTKKEIMNYLNNQAEEEKKEQKRKEDEEHKKEIEEKRKEEELKKQAKQKNAMSEELNQTQETSHKPQQKMVQEYSKQPEPIVLSATGPERRIEEYFNKNNLHIENKNKTEKGILYTTLLQLPHMKLHFDCFFFMGKKVTEADIISFYASSMKPKIIFIENTPKKISQLSESFINCTLVNL